mmetsp:Transcript_12234/g.10535  ORF Transcript_12234/g.10535 Transcript_12234/m.10535 type:complete len:133 (-) Transcript_12234:548-946(-)
MFDVADTKFFVTLPAFCAKIEFWKAYAQDRELEDIKDNAMKIVSESKKKLTSADSKKKNMMIRPLSGNLYGSARPFSGISAISTKSKGTMYSTGMDFNKTNAPSNTDLTRHKTMNQSKSYIKMNKDREERKR